VPGSDRICKRSRSGHDADPVSVHQLPRQRWHRPVRRGPDFPSYADYPETDGQGWRIRVEPAADFDRERAARLGGRRHFALTLPWPWEFRARDRVEMARVMAALRDMGVAFLSAGPGWHAGGIFEMLISDGLVSGPYRAIWWRGPGHWETGAR
jgi:hypothetical protein